jgi:hypothetical protein
MAEIALETAHKLLPYLVSEVGRPVGLDLAARGHMKEALVVLREALLPLDLRVWSPDAYQVQLVQREITWLAADLH